MLAKILLALAALLAVTQAQDACNNANDTAVITQPGFQSDYVACSQTALGNRQQTAACLEPFGLSANCADCFGLLTECTGQTCASCATDPSSSDCASCVNDKCMGSFTQCSGIVYMPNQTFTPTTPTDSGSWVPTAYPTTAAPTNPTQAPTFALPVMVYGYVNLNQEDINYNAVVVGSTVGVLCGVATLLVLFSNISVFKTVL